MALAVCIAVLSFLMTLRCELHKTLYPQALAYLEANLKTGVTMPESIRSFFINMETWTSRIETF